MVSLLESFLKNAIAAGFKGQLCKGTLRRPGGTTVNAFGDVVTAPPTTWPIGECIRESLSKYYKGDAGIPEDDAVVLVLLGTVAVVPQQHDQILVQAPFNRWHEVIRVLEIDPAGASGRYHCTDIPTPT